MSLGLWAGEIESRIAGSCAMRVAECCPECGIEGLLSCNEEALRIDECGHWCRVFSHVCVMLMEERDCGCVNCIREDVV